MVEVDHLYRVLQEMGGCNDFAIKDVKQWPDIYPEFDYCILNSQAARLSQDEELFIYIDGEEQEVDALTRKYSLFELDDFLNEVFDGYLHDQFTV